MEFYSHGYTPIYVRHESATANRTIMYNPTASARVVITDITVSTSVSTTFRLEFGTSKGFVFMDHWCQGSAMVYPLSGGVIDSLQMDCPIVVSWGLAQSNGGNLVSIQGFEDRV